MDLNSESLSPVHASDKEFEGNSFGSVTEGTTDGFGTITEFQTSTIQNKLAKCSLVEENSKKNLTKLHKIGKELVTNVVVASENQEQEERCSREIHANEMRDFVNQSQKNAENLFNEVISRWKAIPDAKIPQTLQKLFLSLTVECEGVLKKKDAIIDKLKEELEQKRNDSVLNRERYEKEVQLICQRMNALVDNLNRSGNAELSLIKTSLDDVRQEMVIQSSRSFDEILKKKEDSNEKYDNFRSEIWIETHKLHSSLLVEYNKLALIRKELSEEVHKFLLQLQKVETTQFLNMDKLIYGLHVLQEQVRENKIISSEMKRSNIRSFDVLLRLRTQLKLLNQKGEVKYQDEILRFRRTRERLFASIKSIKFLHNSHKRNFSALFTEREAHARQLIRKVLKIDLFIFETLLDAKWQSPDLSFLAKKPMQTATKKEKLLERLRSFLMPSEDGILSVDNSSPSSETFGETCLKLKKPLDTEKLLQFVCDNLDFFIDKQVLQLSKSVFPDTKTFIISNSIFNAMGIQTAEDLNMLLAYVLHHSTVLQPDEVAVSAKNILMAFSDYIVSHGDKMVTQELLFDIKPRVDVREEPEFWKHYASVLPPIQHQLWDAIIFGLKEFVAELEKQVHLCKLKSSLMLQNQELQRLFHHQLKDTGVIRQ